MTCDNRLLKSNPKVPFMKNQPLDKDKFKSDYPYLNLNKSNKTHYFKGAIANLLVLLAFIGGLIMIFGFGYLGAMGFNKQMTLIGCIDSQNLAEAGGEISATIIENCSKMNVEIKNKWNQFIKQ